MKTIKENFQSGTAGLVSDKIAAIVAGKITLIQFKVSGCLNRRFNSYSTFKKKRLLFTIGGLLAILLITSAFTSFYTIPKLSQNFTSVHIGMPSDVPGLKLNKRQLTDSLNLKK